MILYARFTFSHDLELPRGRWMHNMSGRARCICTSVKHDVCACLPCVFSIHNNICHGASLTGSTDAAKVMLGSRQGQMMHSSRFLFPCRRWENSTTPYACPTSGRLLISIRNALLYILALFLHIIFRSISKLRPEGDLNYSTLSLL